METAAYLGFPAPLSALQLPQGLEVCWLLLGHPCLQWGLGTLGLHGRQHLRQNSESRGWHQLYPLGGGGLSCVV